MEKFRSDGRYGWSKRGSVMIWIAWLAIVAIAFAVGVGIGIILCQDNGICDGSGWDRLDSWRK